jgi:hypothetical protein
MIRLVSLPLIALATTAAFTPLPLPGTCSEWVSQTGPIRWRMCTDPQNQQYCESKEGRRIMRIACP